MIKLVAIAWKYISDRHPILALILFVLSPIVIVTVIFVPIHYIIRFVVDKTGSRKAVGEYIDSVIVDVRLYVEFVISEWKYAILYAIFVVLVYLICRDCVVVRDSFIVFGGVLLTIAFLLSKELVLNVNRIGYIFICYVLYLIMTIGPFLPELLGVGPPLFNRWYSYIFVFFPVASGGLYLAVKNVLASRKKAL
jgi:hypothetical protein